MRRFLLIAWTIVAAVATLTACYKDDISTSTEEYVPEGYMALSVPITMSDEEVIATRGVDPDGLHIHSMSLFCFDKFGLFISYIKDVTLEIAAGTNNGKITKALVPENTRRIHFVANQNLATFNESEHRGMHEEQVMTELVSSSGMMIYWARYTDDDAGNATDFKNNLSDKHGTEGTAIKMLRNQAKVTVSVANGQTFIPEGFVVVNSQAFGTVAPRHPERGFNFDFEGDEWTNNDFVTLPAEPEYQMKLSHPSDVDKAPETYIFETENTSDDPVSVIIKGKARDGAPSLYYRALVLQQHGEGVDSHYEYVMIRRNHHYRFNIVGALSYGVATFEEALVSAPTNNVWLSIDDEVNEVRNERYILGVEKTNVVVLAIPRKDSNGNIIKVDGKTQYEYPKELVLNYNFSTAGGAHIDQANMPEVQWLDNAVARDWMRHNYSDSGTKHSITIELSDISNTTDNIQKTEGTILIRKGLLQRKIKVIVLKQQSFVPMWVTTQMYGGDMDNNPDNGFQGANVTMLFTVPEQTPDELLPFEVMISVDHLDVRPESGQPLPVIRSDDPRYGSDVRKHPHADPSSEEAKEAIGYKYVYTVTQKGDQRVYFKNILDQTNKTQHAGHEDYITIESPYFATMSKPFVFSSGDHSKMITIANLKTYNIDAGDPIYYMLVPAKKGAHVKFDIRLMNGNESTAGTYRTPQDNAHTFDEFLLYSEYLNHNEHPIESTDCYAHFTTPIEKGRYGTNTRTFGMHFAKAPLNGTINETTYDNVYPIQMYTNRAKSAEVVRLASNQKNSPSVLTEYNGATYNGNTYRSVIFELENYRPFRFMASVAGEGLTDGIDHDATQSMKPNETNVSLTYEPSQDIDVAFDITDFIAEDGAIVDPFGQEFEVFINAPMLEWNSSNSVYNQLLAEGKVGVTDDGVFWYKVSANRDEEKAFWDATAPHSVVGEATTTAHSNNGRKKLGERKVLPFKTKSGQIVTAGEIRISADTEKVIYDEKVFNITNLPITGSITYGDTTGQENQVPAGAFVSFSLDKDNSRIGSIAVTSAGRYELRLRPEYQFTWNNHPINIDYTITAQNGEKTYYSATFENLSDLFNNGNSKPIELKKQEL